MSNSTQLFESKEISKEAAACYSQEEYQTLMLITQQNDLQKLDAYIEKNPAILLKKDPEHGRTLMHWSAGQKQPFMLRIICKHLIKNNHLKWLVIAEDNAGNTPFHYCSHYSSAETAAEFLLQLSPEMQQAAATNLNHSGANAIDFSKTNKLGCGPLMYSLLIEIASKNQSGILPLDVKIQESVVLAKYPESKHNPALQENLKLACKIANIARQLITISSSHPECNDYTDEDAELAQEKVEQVQDLINSEVSKLYAEYEEGGSLLNLAICFLAYKAVKSYRAGNCGEFADTCLALLMLENPHKGGAICQVVNGDHVFMKIGSDEKSSVYCDAWSGQIFLARDANDTLKYWKEYENMQGQFVCVTGKINPKYNSIKEARKIAPLPKTELLEEELQDQENSQEAGEQKDIAGNAKKRKFDGGATLFKSVKRIKLMKQNVKPAANDVEMLEVRHQLS